jgi:hypothetical protein
MYKTVLASTDLETVGYKKTKPLVLKMASVVALRKN